MGECSLESQSTWRSWERWASLATLLGVLGTLFLEAGQVCVSCVWRGVSAGEAKAEVLGWGRAVTAGPWCGLRAGVSPRCGAQVGCLSTARELPHACRLSGGGEPLCSEVSARALPSLHTGVLVLWELLAPP